MSRLTLYKACSARNLLGTPVTSAMSLIVAQKLRMEVQNQNMCARLPTCPHSFQHKFEVPFINFSSVNRVLYYLKFIFVIVL